ncbi:MAG: antibiotic biosynthesis monooxygenase family protein [Dehalococcoidia bacterium]
MHKSPRLPTREILAALSRTPNFVGRPRCRSNTDFLICRLSSVFFSAGFCRPCYNYVTQRVHEHKKTGRERAQGGKMVKGILGWKIKKNVDIEPLLLKLRSHAMQYQGFKTMESLVGEDDASVVATLSTWETPQHWRLWIESTITQELLRQAQAFLVEAPRVTTYMVMMLPAITWV